MQKWVPIFLHTRTFCTRTKQCWIWHALRDNTACCHPAKNKISKIIVCENPSNRCPQNLWATSYCLENSIWYSGLGVRTGLKAVVHACALSVCVVPCTVPHNVPRNVPWNVPLTMPSHVPRNVPQCQLSPCSPGLKLPNAAAF